jgi:hypothetical protein
MILAEGIKIGIEEERQRIEEELRKMLMRAEEERLRIDKTIRNYTAAYGGDF